jgi:mxaA protein
MRRRWLEAALGLLSLAASAVASAADGATFATTPIRQYGYVIGDEIVVEGSADVPRGYAPDADSLPKPGRRGALLELRETLLETQSDDRHRFRARFLVVNSAIAVRTVETPPLAIRFRKAGAADLSITLPGIPVTVSALTPAEVLARDGLEELQPDAPVPRIATTAIRLRLITLAVIAAVLAAWFAWAQGWVPTSLLARRPFARARSAIARLGTPANERVLAEQARRIHRAFDESAGFAVTDETLDRFFERCPTFTAARGDIRSFFEASNRYFFAENGLALPSMDTMQQLVRRLAECEYAAGRKAR